MILFGEWCYAKHSVFYDGLPGWFVGFDLYDKSEGRFFSVERRNDLFEEMDIAGTPLVGRGRFTLSELKALFARSSFGGQPSEGLYLRRDCDAWLLQRAKLVRPAFVQSLEEHWSRAPVTPNRLRPRSRTSVGEGLQSQCKGEACCKL